MEYLNSNNIYPGVHYKDNTRYEMYSYARGTCPNSHVISEEVISLPLHMFLTNQEVEYIADKVKEAVKK
jgi:dTDP-4-amino-4,6-dideoxygalactose transaminase